MDDQIVSIITTVFGTAGAGIIIVAWMNRKKTRAEAMNIEASALATLSPVMSGWIDRLEVKVQALEEEVEKTLEELKVERAHRRAYESALIEARLELPVVVFKEG